MISHNMMFLGAFTIERELTRIIIIKIRTMQDQARGVADHM